MLIWVQHLVNSKYVEPGNMSYTRCLEIRTWLNQNILNLVTCHTHINLDLEHSQTQVYWVWQLVVP